MALISDIKNESTLKTVEENDKFYMYTYKIVTCPRKYSHDWTSCPYAHSGESARRRDPSLYKPIPCPESKGGAPCPRGDSCKYAHNDFEYWLHPGRYKTEYCKQGPGCSRKICFFAHRPDDIRKTPSVVYTNQGPFLTSIKSNVNNTVSNEQQQQQQTNTAINTINTPASPSATNSSTKFSSFTTQTTTNTNNNSQSFNPSISNNTSTVAAGFSSLNNIQHQKRLSLDTYDSINLNNDFFNALRFPSFDSNISSSGNLGAAATVTSPSCNLTSTNSTTEQQQQQQNQVMSKSNAVSLSDPTSVSMTGEAFTAFQTPMMPGAAAANANLMVPSTSTGAFENVDHLNHHQMSLAAFLAAQQQQSSSLRDINTATVNVNKLNSTASNNNISSNSGNMINQCSTASSPTSAFIANSNTMMMDPSFNFETQSQVQQALNLVATYGAAMPLSQDPGFLQRSAEVNMTDSIWSPNRSNFDLLGNCNNTASTITTVGGVGSNIQTNIHDADFVNQLHQGLQVQIDQYKLLQQNLQMLKCNTLTTNSALSDTYQTRRSSFSDYSDASPSYIQQQQQQQGQNINALPLLMNDIVSFPSSSTNATNTSSSPCPLIPGCSSTANVTTPPMTPNTNVNNILFNGLATMPSATETKFENIHRRSLSDMQPICSNSGGMFLPSTSSSLSSPISSSTTSSTTSSINGSNGLFEMNCKSGILENVNVSQQPLTSFPSENFSGEIIYNNNNNDILKQ